MKKLAVGLLLSLLLSGCVQQSTKRYSQEEDEKMVLKILENLDSHTLDIDSKMSVYSEDVVHMGPGNPAITGRTALREMLVEESKWGYSEMKHQAYEIHSFDDHVIVRGGVKGTWYAKDGSNSMPFQTNNLITLKRSSNGELKIWHVIFNRVESE